MSLVQYGVDNGFVEIGQGCLVIYPKRIINATVLKETIREASEDNYELPQEFNFSEPIVMKKKNIIDMTEVLVKLFALTLRYGVNLKVQTFSSADSDNIRISFTYKNKEVIKNFDPELLCAMEKDFVLGWFEEMLQKIDDELKEKEKKDE